ncbi:cbb3-type cytochrome c oxidase subunit 3 [Aestuariibius sp. HNIBRBA575]|uniref:cbb3-type cytochrome c oxidase subunit 3 n=1 Tax=Aestuariibius sp. HNIBRBA575 TaxID=3233343 RepID=UPI0034A3CC0B
MDTYSIFREIADSWVLLAMFVFFGGVVAWAFRPGSRAIHQDVANVPFRHDDAPAPDVAPKISEAQS